MDSTRRSTALAPRRTKRIPVAACAVLPHLGASGYVRATAAEAAALGPNGYAERCRGMSMFFRGIDDGGLVFVNPDLLPVPGQVVVADTISPQGHLWPVVKVWMTDGAAQWLQSEGAGYAHAVYLAKGYAGNTPQPAQHFAVRGVVLYAEADESARRRNPGWPEHQFRQPIRPRPPAEAACNTTALVHFTVRPEVAALGGADPVALQAEVDACEAVCARESGWSDEAGAARRAAKDRILAIMADLARWGGVRPHTDLPPGARVAAIELDMRERAAQVWNAVRYLEALGVFRQEVARWETGLPVPAVSLPRLARSKRQLLALPVAAGS